ncbi:hypothetical protein D3C80_1838410 [compost metagenome]
MRMAFSSPTKAAAHSPAKIPKAAPYPVASNVMKTRLAISTETPTDRSMPPAVITIVMPRATIASSTILFNSTL